MRRRTPQRPWRSVAGLVAVSGLVATGISVPPATAADGDTVPYPIMFNNFETSVGSHAPPWTALDVPGPSGVAAVVSTSSDDVRTRVSHARSLKISQRDDAGDGAQMEMPGSSLTPGQAITVSLWAYVKDDASLLDPGEPVAVEIRAGGTPLSPVAGTDLVLVPGVWERVTATYTYSSETTLEVSVSNTLADVFVDDVLLAGTRAGAPVPVTGTLRDALDYPVGVAVERRSTVAGSPAETLLSANFDQVTPENAMKPESWYGADRKFAGSAGAQLTENEGADALMDWAAANGGRVYGHVLVWHGQTPDWFYLDDAGNPLDATALAARMRTHIFDVAEYLSSRYGAFGSATNPLSAFDVVNEVVADSTSGASNGMRTSTWYGVLGEEFVDLAFRYADEAFNDVYAAPGADRPVALFINEYGTESGDAPGTKLERYHALVERLLSRDVPIDGVGHQYHVNLSTRVDNLRAGLAKFVDTGLRQAVTEFDVTTGYPQTQRLAIRQGGYYSEAFAIFDDFAAQHPGSLYSVTVWGLSDADSWLYFSGGPLMFDEFLQPKWALAGATGQPVPAEPRSMLVFAGSQDLTADAPSNPAWTLLPPAPIGSAARFSVRWAEDHLTLWVDVDDTHVEPTDHLTVTRGAESYSFSRSATGTRTVPGVSVERPGGWTAVLHVPLARVGQGDQVSFDVGVTDGGATAGWNSPGILGSLELVEALSSVDVAEVDVAPVVDGEVDDVWSQAATVSTGKVTQGTTAAASADVRTVWSGDGSSIFVLAEVTDASVSLAPSNPWEKDSVELFLDVGNAKNGAYRAQDVQIRIDADNVVSSGASRVVASQTARTDTGYRVEAEIDLLGAGGPGTIHGMDVQVNDATGNQRTGVKAWADPTGQGYASTARWGVARLVERPAPTLSLDVDTVRAGDGVVVTATGLAAGEVELVLVAPTTARAASPAGTSLGTITVGADGSGRAAVTVPAQTAAGSYVISARAGGTEVASAPLTVLAATPATTPPAVVTDPAPGTSGGPGAVGGGGGSGTDVRPGAGGSGALASTGGDVAVLSLVVLTLLGAGGAVLHLRRRVSASE